ncbi:hypothetical protein DC31_02275 [Microbacterium sp. CH12i]|uniref:hypothetical protein n=1 Tax=Microbacterium sp. CH12i TaxID=1479651 RepID=UPI0004619FBA|nr:hypothetical protein [Microbacterium sp. CH12i]KDA04912.1 hypothetical protein DC31_02275 [Microbacterium sp. CH12i]
MKHTFTKAAVITAIAAGALFAVPTAASAYTPTPTGDTSSSTVVAGGSFTFSVQAGAFLPGETVSISLTGENASGATLGFVKFAVQTQALGTTTANGAGGVGGASITLPANASGTYTILATSPSNPVGAAATITVSAAGTDNKDNLAATGMDSTALLTTWVAGGALVLAGGGVAVAAAVRRNKQNAAA